MRRSDRRRWIAVLLAAVLSFGAFIPSAAPAQHASASVRMAPMPGMPAKTSLPGRACHVCNCAAGLWMIAGNCLPLAVASGILSFAPLAPAGPPVPEVSPLEAGLSIPPSHPPPIAAI